MGNKHLERENVDWRQSEDDRPERHVRFADEIVSENRVPKSKGESTGYVPLHLHFLFSIFRLKRARITGF